MNLAHLGKRTLSLPRLRCSLDVIFVVTFPPFWFASCSVVSTYLVDWRNFFFPHTASVHTYPLAGEYGIRIRNFLNPRPEWKFLNTLWIQNRVDAKCGYIYIYIYIYIFLLFYFFILWCNKIEPSSLSWKVEQDTKFAGFMTHFLLPIFPGSPEWKIESRYVSDTCGRANSMSTRIRACGRGHFWVRKEKYPDTCGRGLGEKSFVLSLSQNYINLSGSLVECKPRKVLESRP